MEGKIILAISLIVVLLVGVVSFDDAFAEEKITICHLPDSDKANNMNEPNQSFIGNMK